MKNLKFASLVIILAAAALSGCKDDSDTTYLSFSGKISFAAPEYVAAGYSQSIKLSEITTISADDGVEVGYYFTFLGEKDTVRTAFEDYVYSFTVPDTLASISVGCTAYAEGYYGSSCTRTLVVVDPAPGKSLGGLSTDRSDGFFDYAGGAMPYKRLGGNLWTMLNLPPTRVKGSSFKDYEVLGSVYGGYFTWEEAQGVCPDGWRLPSAADWDALALSLGGTASEGSADFSGAASRMLAPARLNGVDMWQEGVIAMADTTGFSAIPAGYAMVDGASRSHGGLGTYAAFWSSQEHDGQGVYRYINYASDMLYEGTADKKGFAASVRCVKNKD